MARKEARIKTRIWDDDDFCSLTSGEQWLYFILLSQKDLTMCGVLPDHPDWWAGMARGVDQDIVETYRDGLVACSYLVRDERSHEVWIRTLIRNDEILETANFTVAMARSYGAIRSKGIRKGVMEELAKEFPEGVLEGMSERFDKPDSKPLAKRLPEDFLEAVHAYAPSHLVTRSSLHQVTPPSGTPISDQLTSGFDQQAAVR